MFPACFQEQRTGHPKNQLEFLCASWDGVEILNVGESPFVPLSWKP